MGVPAGNIKFALIANQGMCIAVLEELKEVKIARANLAMRAA